MNAQATEKKIMLKFKNNAKILKDKTVIRCENDIAEKIRKDGLKTENIKRQAKKINSF